jgi:hypothetical protein
MPCLGHGEVATPEQLQEAERDLVSRTAEIDLGFARRMKPSARAPPSCEETVLRGVCAPRRGRSNERGARR